jgi:hypothetical protein
MVASLVKRTTASGEIFGTKNKGEEKILAFIFSSKDSMKSAAIGRV